MAAKTKGVKLTQAHQYNYELCVKSRHLTHEECLFMRLMASFAKSQSFVNRTDFLRAEQLVEKAGL